MSNKSRLDQALEKLYSAFNSGALHPECCKQCAVGTILDSTDSWKHLSDNHGSLKLNYVGRINESFGRRFNGYRPSELLLIEKTFLEACGYELPIHHQNYKPLNPTESNRLFKGLSAVVGLLCKLDNSPNVFDTDKWMKLLNQESSIQITP